MDSGLYLVLKLGALVMAGNIGLIFTGYPYNINWWIEILVGIVAPIVLFNLKSVRKSDTKLFWVATLVVLGLVINRFNVSMFALGMRPGYTYVPTWMEFAISAGLVADSMLVIWLAYKLLPMFQHEPGQAISPAPGTR